MLPTLTESMRMVDEILSDEQMDRLEKIEKLEAILSTVTTSAADKSNSDSDTANFEKCSCLCHDRPSSQMQQKNAITVDVPCQTLSTGDIVITRIFFTDEEKERTRLMNSPKK